MCFGGSVSRRKHISGFVCFSHKDIIAVAGNGQKACTLCERMPFSLMLNSYFFLNLLLSFPVCVERVFVFDLFYSLKWLENISLQFRSIVLLFSISDSSLVWLSYSMCYPIQPLPARNPSVILLTCVSQISVPCVTDCCWSCVYTFWQLIAVL